jgi:hypothetical protein
MLNKLIIDNELIDTFRESHQNPGFTFFTTKTNTYRVNKIRNDIRTFDIIKEEHFYELKLDYIFTKDIKTLEVNNERRELQKDHFLVKKTIEIKTQIEINKSQNEKRPKYNQKDLKDKEKIKNFQEEFKKYENKTNYEE